MAKRMKRFKRVRNAGNWWKRQPFWKRLLPLGFALLLCFAMGGCAHTGTDGDASRLLKSAHLEKLPRGGFLITDIDGGSPWDRAGLKNGDEITKADGDSLAGSNAMMKLLGAIAAPGGSELQVLRPNKRFGGQTEQVVLKPKRSE